MNPSAIAPVIEGVFNFRDVGGMPTRSGGTTRPGVLYRSDALATLSDAGIDALTATKICTIVDFRTVAERAQAPNRLPARGVHVVRLSLLEGALTGGALSSLPSLPDLYIGMLRHGPRSFAAVARLVADSSDGVLIHCTAGKDRTGVATALLLDAVGVERAAIVADYTASELNLAGAWAERMLARAAEWGVPLTPGLVELVTATPAPAIEAALAWVDDNGGSTAYLREGGLEPDAADRLRARLVS